MAAQLAPTSALSDALVILGAAGIVIPAFARFRITPIIGFIVVGLLVGPYGLGSLVKNVPWLQYVTISNPHAIEPFAEFGIILLLFEIGLELSFNRLWAMRRLVFGLGVMELFGSALFVALVLMGMGQHVNGAMGMGLALALSSTALVLPISGTHGPVGRAALAMLLFEDIALVPIIFLLGALAPVAAEGAPSLVDILWKGALVIAALLVFGRVGLPRLFAQAAKTKSPELFLAASLLVVIAASLATGAAGLSPIMGALLAGLLIAETEYHTEVEAITKPFKGLALGVFLITVGMGIDLRVVAANFGPLALGVLGVVVAKALITGLLLRLWGQGRAIALETGILMASPSETTLIVLGTAAQAQLIQPATAQFWQIVTAIGLTITPLLAHLGRVSAGRLRNRGEDVGESVEEPEGQRTIILGFGRVGRLIGEMLAEHDRPYLAIDRSPPWSAGRGPRACRCCSAISTARR
jgi:CPA2 family monovalent cation:H+ antiporter-2